MVPLAVAFRTLSPVTDEEILALSRANPLHRFERTAEGELVVAPPSGTGPSRAEGDLFGQLWAWNKRAMLGQVCPSSAGFHLPDSALRAPDAAWISNERWEALPLDQRREGFAHLCPDVVFELLSPTDRIAAMREKLAEYLRNGARLAVLLAPKQRLVELHRPGRAVETLLDPRDVALDPELPGFVLDVASVFSVATARAGAERGIEE